MPRQSISSNASPRPHARAAWRRLSQEASFLDYSLGCHELPSRCSASLRRRADRARRAAWAHMLDVDHSGRVS
ncbi:hypothetical protein [Acetobacter nitrogenifigens]|uniref:hypothetical protein n=1 Tax=Acetobacter nitrogenifigens TaxID=285268 RepID=UPI0022310D59|nr:hypothetical protein [Acetobacter nitrogenifigens]